ncbi:acetyltransferase [Agrobacterium phage Alfirin]|nr:acetyltransferase [Agrobacterium phage Alfirin]
MIEYLKLQHIPSLLAFLEELHEETPTFNVTEDHVWVESQLIRMIGDENHIMLCVTGDAGEVIAVMFGAVGSQWYSPDLEGYEMLLAVSPRYRGSPVAYRLINRFVGECKRRHAKTIFAGSSLGIHDERAVALYERLGFVRHGVGLTKRI